MRTMAKVKANSMETERHTPLQKLSYIAGIIIVSGFLACNDGRIYDHYEHIEADGWERSDTVSFGFPCTHDGTYSINVGLRANQKFPYKTISMIVEQTIFPSRKTWRDTITCQIIDDNGYLTGKHGISNCEIRHNLTNYRLQKNDSVRIRINHCMRRETIPGISEIGINATRLQ